MRVHIDYSDGRHTAMVARPGEKYVVEVPRWQWWLFCLHCRIDRRIGRWLADLDNVAWDAYHEALEARAAREVES